jgi:protein-tyrosine phosphatase
MAEFIFKELVIKNHLEDYFEVLSRATSYEESGNDIYPKAKKVLDLNGISYSRHYAKRITLDEYNKADYILAMEEYNLVNLKRIVGELDLNKVFLLRNWSNPKKDIEDPWYSGNFNKVYQEIYEGCFDFLNKVSK